MTVIELIHKLTAMPPDAEVEAWMPGSIIKLDAVMAHRNGRVMIEGNMMPGSALDPYATDADIRAFRAHIGLKGE